MKFYMIFAHISIHVISITTYSQWPTLQLAWWAQGIERCIRSSQRSRFDSQSRLNFFSFFFFFTLRLFILLRRSCSLSEAPFLVKNFKKISTVVVRFFFFLVRFFLHEHVVANTYYLKCLNSRLHTFIGQKGLCDIQLNFKWTTRTC